MVDEEDEQKELLARVTTVAHHVTYSDVPPRMGATASTELPVPHRPRRVNVRLTSNLDHTPYTPSKAVGWLRALDLPAE